MKKVSAQDKIQRKNDLLAVFLLIGFAFFINRGIEVKGLYMDDLYLWSTYGEQSFWQYIFPIGSTRFRFLFYLAAWLELFFLGHHLTWIVPLNIVLNGLLAAGIYYLGRKLSNRTFVGIVIGILFLLSRLSYYQISQLYGLMETIALFLAVWMFYLLFLYVNGAGPKRNLFFCALGVYFALVFVHERYMVLLPLFFLVLLMKKNKKLLMWGAPVLVFVLIQLIRLMTIGGVLPAGTGGTNVSDTFSVKTAVKHGLSQVAYLFGINAGPTHLNGLTWGEVPLGIKALVYFSIAVLLTFAAAFLIRAMRDKHRRVRHLHNTLLFVCFIGLCIASASVTVRVEMRWVYVSYSCALLFWAYMMGVLLPPAPAPAAVTVRPANWAALGGMALYLVLVFPVELFFRGHYPNLYFWPNQLRYNSLAEETYEKYGEELFGKTIYILGNSYEMSDFTARTFFKVFDRERKAEGTQVVFIEDVRDIGLINDRMLVLMEEPEHNAFQDVTEFVRREKLKPEYGYYRDEWMDEECKIRVECGKEGKLHLAFMYPGVLTGTEETRIMVNGEEYLTIPVTKNEYAAEITGQTNQRLELEIINNFFLQDAKEQRGEKRFTAKLSITSE